MVTKKKRTRSPTTNKSSTISGMYARWTLERVVEAASAVATDFVSRPRQYASVKDDTLKHLENLWFRTGSDPGFPSASQRQMIFTPLLGPSDSTVGEHASQFHDNSRALRERARAFTERQVQTGEENLRQAFRDEVDTFGSYLTTLVGNAVVQNGNRQTSSIFEISSAVLRDDKVAAVFGRPPADSSIWPLDKNFEDKGARLIEEITKTLETSSGMVTQSQFIVTQRIALHGAHTIDGVLDADRDIDDLIQLTYSWKTALDALNS